MFDKPSGLIDNRSCQDGFNRSNFSLYDAADEEVHFTRTTVSQARVDGMHQGAFYGKSQANPRYEDLKGQLNSSAYIKMDRDDKIISEGEPEYHNNKFEQARSTRLLNTISTKLRRGSNYLAAPSIVGSYLLGITIQSWSEFLDTSRMMKVPSNTHHLTRRLISNLGYFRGNYLCVALILVIYCILTSPLLLLAIIGYVLALYFVTTRSASGRGLKIAGFKPNLQQQYYFLTLVSLPMLWVAGAPSAVFWVIGASFVVVGLHASIYNMNLTSDEVSLDEAVVNSELKAGSFAPSMAVQYHNHYQTNHYLPLATPETQPVHSNRQANWNIFGYLSSRDQKQDGQGLSTSNEQPKRIPEVKIISQDFAGLGRVYEV